MWQRERTALTDDLSWTVEEAFQQLENPDPAMNLTPPASGGGAYDLTILEDVLALTAAALAFSEIPVVVAAGNVFNLIGALLSTSELEDGAIQAAVSDDAVRTYIANLNSQLIGMQDNVQLLQSINPVTQPDTYRIELLSFNTVIVTAMPQFKQDQFRRWATPLFMTAASIHLNVLRKLIDTSTDDPAPWTNSLWSNAAAYATWLSGTRSQILDARDGEVGELQGSTVAFNKDSFHDYRLVGGDSHVVYVAPAATAPASRDAYIVRRRGVFADADWMQNIDACILGWKQMSKLCNLALPTQFAAAPDGAVFPGIGQGGSYVDLADKIAWKGPNTLTLRVNGAWIQLAVPNATQGAATIDVLGSPGGPSFFVDGASSTQVGLDIKPSGTFAGSVVGVGMILLEPVTADGLLAAFNVLLDGRDGAAAGRPMAVVFDRTVDAAGTTFTVRQTSPVVGFAPDSFVIQNLALETPLPIQAGQVVGFVNTGPTTLSVSWIDGPDHHVWWIGITPSIGWSTTLAAGSAGTPVVACGWNFMSYADIPG